MFNISLRYDLTPSPIHFISYSKFYMLFEIVFGIFILHTLCCYVLFSSNEFGIRFGTTFATNYLSFCVFWKSFCFHSFYACDNQKDRNINFMGANTQWTSSLGGNEKWKKNIQSTNCNLTMCTFSPKVLCTSLYFSH